ncbi:MAG: SH3 domain-containing protein [Myxococcota bacterium]
MTTQPSSPVAFPHAHRDDTALLHLCRRELDATGINTATCPCCGNATADTRVSWRFRAHRRFLETIPVLWAATGVISAPALPSWRVVLLGLVALFPYAAAQLTRMRITIIQTILPALLLLGGTTTAAREHDDGRAIFWPVIGLLLVLGAALAGLSRVRVVAALCLPCAERERRRRRQEAIQELSRGMAVNLATLLVGSLVVSWLLPAPPLGQAVPVLLTVGLVVSVVVMARAVSPEPPWLRLVAARPHALTVETRGAWSRVIPEEQPALLEVSPLVSSSRVGVVVLAGAALTGVTLMAPVVIDAWDKPVLMVTVRPMVLLHSAPEMNSRAWPQPLGTRAWVRTPRWWEAAGWWRVTEDNPVPGYIRNGEGLATLPVASHVEFVVVPTSAVLTLPEASQREILPIGAEVQISNDPRHDVDGHALVIRDHAPIGFIRRTHLRITPPDVEEVMAASLQALRQLDVAECTRLAERAHVLWPEHPHPRALLSAVYDDTKDPRAQAMSRGVAPLPTPRFPPRKGVTVGEPAYVAASVLNLRARPASRSATLTRLPINAVVELLADEREWVRVRTRGHVEALQRVDLGTWESLSTELSSENVAEVSEESNELPLVEGYLLREYLDAVPQDAGELAGTVEEHLAARRVHEATVLLERLFAVDPTSIPVAEQLLDTAIRAQRYHTAIFAVGAIRTLRSLNAFITLENFDVMYGCHGSWSVAEVFTAHGASYHASEGRTSDLVLGVPDDVCLTNVDVSAPCGVTSDAPSLDDMLHAALQDVEHEGDHEAITLRVHEAFELAEEAWEKEKAEADVEERRHGRWLERLREFYAEPSRLRVRLRNDLRSTFRPPQPLFLYARPMEVSDGCDAGVHPSSEIDVRVIPLRPLQPGETIEQWVELSTYEGMEYGVVFAPSADAVRRHLLRSHDDTDGTVTPLGNVQTATTVCVTGCGC